MRSKRTEGLEESLDRDDLVEADSTHSADGQQQVRHGRPHARRHVGEQRRDAREHSLQQRLRQRVLDEQREPVHRSGAHGAGGLVEGQVVHHPRDVTGGGDGRDHLPKAVEHRGGACDGCLADGGTLVHHQLVEDGHLPER